MPIKTFNPKSGVAGHSTPDIWQEFVVFAVDNDAAFQVDFPNAVVLNGCYKGETETSYIVSHTDFIPIELSNHLNNQESILYLEKPEKRSDLRRKAYLYYQDKPKGVWGTFIADEEFIGYMVQVPKAEALTYDAWTHNPNNGAYWVCKKGVI